jgi:hypothetical protein
VLSSVAESPVARLDSATSGLAERLGGFATWLERVGRAPLYVELLRGAARDAEAGGVVARAFERIELPSGSVPALRLMAALHYLVLRGEADALARFYPSAGGADGPDGAWPAAEATMREHFDEVRARLSRGVQTNEPGRSAALFGGLLWASERHRAPLRLLEIGASAGLNLLVERFEYRVGGQRLGAVGSPVRFEEPWSGSPVKDVVAAAGRLLLSERLGCDAQPIDVRATGTRELLLSYVWPDETERLARLGAALTLARRTPPAVERAPASRWLARVLDGESEAEGAGTAVVFQSVMWQYVPAGERRAITDAIELAASRYGPRGLLWLTFEPGEGPLARFELAARTWPGDERTVLAYGTGNGPPIEWLAGR